MTIGSVLSILQAEFPAVTVSKLRFLEDQGLVSPSRTGSGYRKYSPADVERLRYTLTQQRDHFLPLKVIRENLEDLDAGRSAESARPARMVAVDGALVAPARGGRVSVRELSELTGVSHAEIEEMVVAGMLQADARMGGAAVAVDNGQLRIAARQFNDVLVRAQVVIDVNQPLFIEKFHYRREERIRDAILRLVVAVHLDPAAQAEIIAALELVQVPFRAVGREHAVAQDAAGRGPGRLE